MSQCLSTILGETNKQTKQNFFFCLCRFSMLPQVPVKHALKITCSCKSSETTGHRREPSIQSDLLGSTLFQLFSIIIQPHQCPWVAVATPPKFLWCHSYAPQHNSGGYRSAGIPAAKPMPSVCTSSPDHGVGLCGATFPHCRISKMAVWNFVKDLLSWHIEGRHWLAHLLHAVCWHAVTF